jgi:hypothetical protein
MLGRILRDQRGHVVGAEVRPPIAAATLRTDPWWALPATVVVGLVSFLVYGTWAAFQSAHYYADPYLSPFYSPCLYASCLHRTLGVGLPDLYLPILGLLSPAFLILWIPGLFRLTCYYYRKAYYRSFWWAPAACGVRDARAGYAGETRFPLILQNFHRYAWYLAATFPFILAWDALLAFRFPQGFGIGVGTLVMWVNVILLTGYTYGCHSCRHVCGGHVDVFSKAPARFGLWRLVSRLNEQHPAWAWLSLCSVALTDVYIRLVSLGIIHDYRWTF